MRLTATDFKFDPKSPRVDESGTVKFVVENAGQAPHALEVEGPSGEAETETIQPGDSGEVSVDLDKAGAFTMYCPVGNHRQMGMEGKVFVLSRSGAGGGAQTAPETETETETEDESGSGGGSRGY